MGSTFNPQILVEKLTKLNASQASIETLSHWCIFHMNKAKYVVETWNKQFHCSPREQRLAFLYLANDILQNSRRKGADFVAEFWKFLPGALHDVIKNGDASGRNQALRLINIWDERKVFGSRGHALKDELLGRRQESTAKTGRQFSLKLNQSAGSSVDKIISGYEVIYGGELDEDVILLQCRNAASFVEKTTKDVSGNINSDGAHVVELQHQHTLLRGCIDQLKAVEASRARLVSHLREALQEEEFKLDQLRTQLQAAKSLSEQASNKLQPSPESTNAPLVGDRVPKESQSPKASSSQAYVPQSAEHSYTRQAPFPETSDSTEGQSAAAVVAAKLTASTSSAQMLTYVLSSLAQEGVIGNGAQGALTDFPPEKKPKLENDQPYVPSNSGSNHHQQPPPPPLPVPLVPPYPMPQYMLAAGPMSNVPYNYGNAPPPPVSGYPPLAPPPPPPNQYQAEGGFYAQQATPLPSVPISRQ